jgi:protein-S-isoprenylcysteine O-methyltransferase Ste14
MMFSDWLIAASWLVFVVYWFISARGVKRNLGSGPWKKTLWLRAAILVGAIMVFRLPTLRHALWLMQQYLDEGGRVLRFAGATLCALGIAFAVWARRYLGRNWGMPMSRKEDPDLVTGGPYAYVRHPIYGGLLIAMLGSTLGGMIAWLIPLLLCGAYFVYSARKEEKLMLEQFPEQYAAYMQRTRMFVPFVI